MILAALALTPAAALAQSRTVPPLRDDPAYLEYLDQLDRIDDLVPEGHETPQIDLGMVGVLDPDEPGADIGLVFASQPDPTLGLPATARTEHWFVSDLSFFDDPSRDFLLVMDDPTCVDPVPELPGTWLADDYVGIDFVYKQSPDGADLVYAGPQVQRTSFELIQGGVQVGAMLRETHLNPDLSFSHYVEHWLFFREWALPGFGEFKMLKAVGDELLVTSDTFQFGTTANFFSGYSGVTKKAYAKPEYGLAQTGSDSPWGP